MTTETFIVVVSTDVETLIFEAELDENWATIARSIHNESIQNPSSVEKADLLVDFMNYLEDNAYHKTEPFTVTNATIINFYFGA